MPLPVPPHSLFCCCLLLILPWPVVVSVSVNLGFFPYSTMTHCTWPPLLVNVPPAASHCRSLGEAANAGAAKANTNMAATTRVEIFPIMFLLFLVRHLPPWLGRVNHTFIGR